MTTFSCDRQPGKGRGPSRTVTKVEVQSAWNQLRTAAAAGDLQASALLIALAENKPVIAMGALTA